MTFASFMCSFKTSVRSFAQDETGATAIEYGLIAGLVSLAIIAGVTAVGTDLSALFTKIGTSITTAKGT